MSKILIYQSTFLSFCLLCLDIQAQTVKVVRDDANLGQYKRMVYEQWDYWSPDPGTNWLGLPKDPYGWFFWKVLHASYYNGEDKRPYKAGGPFGQNLALVNVQVRDDNRIADSLKKVADGELKTYTSMLGGAGDLSYEVYFKDVFEENRMYILNRANQYRAKFPVAVAKFLDNGFVKDYFIYLEQTLDRINIVHGTLMDRGERLLKYMQIEKELEIQKDKMESLLLEYVHATHRKPRQDELRSLRTSVPKFDSDKKIVEHILKTHKF